jgi:DMSO/TMAO reductase YedYZ molybdopterin-dependent catalytic subunit
MASQESGRLIFRQQDPDNLEGPPEIFEASVTPLDAFFIRSHFDVPQLSAEQWRLRVEGALDHPLELDLEELTRFKDRSVRATMECAGNSRAGLGERAQGVPWRAGAIGTAQWDGLSLRQVLEEADLHDEVVEVIFVGADKGTVQVADGGRIEMPYARSLPIEKAMSDEVLIATHMNGAPLTNDHGYPARLVVPGWYGMASVKWLVRIIATTERFDGYFQTEDYARWQEEEGLVVRRPLGKMLVKSHIGSPVDGQAITAGETVTIRGFAWGGQGHIDAVEVSVDGGDSYEKARLLDSDHPFAWRRWEYEWQVPESPGEFTLSCRARTDAGEVQPPGHDWKSGAYEVNEIRPVTVEIVRR